MPIGRETADRRWINYEIRRVSEEGKGLFGIYVHGLRSIGQGPTTKGRNPFDDFKAEGTPLSSIVKAQDPLHYDSKDIYNHVAVNLTDWIDDAIATRARR